MVVLLAKDTTTTKPVTRISLLQSTRRPEKRKKILTSSGKQCIKLRHHIIDTFCGNDINSHTSETYAHT